MTEQYRIYDRKTLKYVDGGIIRDYTVDMDYLSNNASTVTLVEETYAKKGDIVVGMKGTGKLFIGTVTAVDNTKKTVSFKHMKELFNDTVINVFKYSNILDHTFDAVGAVRDLIAAAFIGTDDPERNLPLIIETRGVANGACYTDSSDTMNVLDFVQQMFDSHNIYLDFDIDFVLNKIVCVVAKNTNTGVVIKDNIKLSEPTFDKNELPSYNKAIVYDGKVDPAESGGNVNPIIGTYYLLENNTVTEDSSDPRRLFPVQTKFISYEDDEEDENQYTPFEVAASELQGNIYNHCIQYKLSKEQNLVKPLSFSYGDGLKIIYKDREYDSIFTGLKFNKSDPYYTCLFGKTRLDFTDRLKQYIDKRYRKR